MENLQQQNLQTQLDEIELLQSMYSAPDEFHIEDSVSYERTLAYCRQLAPEPAQCMSFGLSLTVAGPSGLEQQGAVVNPDHPRLSLTVAPSGPEQQGAIVNPDHPLEIGIRLDNRYPEAPPHVYLSSKDLHRTNQDMLNSDLQRYMTTILTNEPCLLNVIEWARDNASTYFPIPTSHNSAAPAVTQTTATKKETFCRVWLYMHHIYSKTKRKNILSLASDLELSGFCLPGKPGVVCIEGTEQNTKQFYSVLRRWNWKSITCRHREEVLSHDIDDCRKITGFEELVLDVQGTHLNLGQFLDYLKRHKLEYMFKELFGVDGQS